MPDRTITTVSEAYQEHSESDIKGKGKEVIRDPQGREPLVCWADNDSPAYASIPADRSLLERLTDAKLACSKSLILICESNLRNRPLRQMRISNSSEQEQVHTSVAEAVLTMIEKGVASPHARSRNPLKIILDIEENLGRVKVGDEKTWNAILRFMDGPCDT
ncbi:hypothetical protein HD806DRAFT_542719 [Xylariaceae sp. AK1471]|nr:hypothetical protein HD806DRAFT_542719 [Xylariaceae sp. AK1471]